MADLLPNPISARSFGNRGHSLRLVLSVALWIAAGTAGPLTTAHAQSSDDTPALAQPRGLLAVTLGSASTGPYGAPLIPGCSWATWVSQCQNLTVYGNGGSFGNSGCGPPNGCRFGSEFQCVELAQRYAYYAWGEPAVWDAGDAHQMWGAAVSLPVPLEQFANAQGIPPQQGDLMVFDQGWLGSYWDGAGHVAIVTNVNRSAGYVEVVEQNATPSGTDRFALRGSTVIANGYTPVIGWLRPFSLQGPANWTQRLGGGGELASAPSAVVSSDGVHHDFWRSPNNHLYAADYTAGRWAGPDDWSTELNAPPDDQLASAPSATGFNGGADLVAVWQGANGHLLHATGNKGRPASLSDLSVILGAPTASNPITAPQVTDYHGQELVFWQGANRDLWQTWSGNGIWSGLQDWTATLGGPPASRLAGAPNVVLSPTGQVLVYWQGVDNQLWEAWYGKGGWAGPLALSALIRAPDEARLASGPAALATPDGGEADVYWRGVNGHLWQAWYSSGVWNGPRDWSAVLGASRSAALASAPHAVLANGEQDVYWQGGNGDLWETWFAGRWYGPSDITATSHRGTEAQLLSAPQVVMMPDGGQQDIYWQGMNGDLWESWWSNGQWSGPENISAKMQAPASTPATAMAGSQLVVFWQSLNGDLLEIWYDGGAWSGPLNLSLSLAAPRASLLQSVPQLVVVGGTDALFWQGANGHLWDLAYGAGSWQGPADVSVQLGLPSAAGLSSAPGVALTSLGTVQLAWRGENTDLWEASLTGSTWSVATDVTPAAGASPSIQPASAPTVLAGGVFGPNRLLWQGQDGHLWVSSQSGNNWSAPVDMTSQLNAPTASQVRSPLSVGAADGQEMVFWRAASGDLWEVWWDGLAWMGPVDVSGLLPGSDPANTASAPRLLIGPAGQRSVFWQGSDGHLREAWYDGAWYGPWDWSRALGAPAFSQLVDSPAVVAGSGQNVVFWQSVAGDLWEAWQNLS
jgi:hypothetical protein